MVEAAPLGVADRNIRALAAQLGGTLYGLGYDEADGWTVVDEREAGDPADLAAVRDELKDWERRTGSGSDGRVVDVTDG